MAFKVPYRTNAEIDHMALDLLRKYGVWKGAPVRPPIDVDDIVEGYLKLDLELSDLKTLLGVSDVLGATWFEDKVIRIDSSLEGKDGRLAFTLAHEIGHWWIHRPIFEMEKVALPLYMYEEHRPATPAVVCRSGQRKEPAEWQADTFAARLIMPAAEVRATVRSLFGDTVPTWGGTDAQRRAGFPDPGLRDVAGQIIERGHFSNVSNEAMRYRLVDLNLVGDRSNPQMRLV